MSYFVIAVVAAVLALALTPVARAVATRLGALDHPGLRKIHTGAIPRLGGLAVAAAAVLAVVIGSWRGVLDDASMAFRPAGIWPWLPLVAGGAIVLAVGLIDDLSPMPALVKLAGQAAGAGAAVALGVRVESVTVLGSTLVLGPLAVPLTFIWILVVTNAFNLVDGLDGLAAGLAIIAAATCAVILAARGDALDAAVLAALVGALCGFLPYNLPPASIFLGDCGSMLLGFVLAVTAVTGFQKGVTALAAGVPLLIFALPIAETVASTARRFFAPGAVPAGSRPALARLGLRLRRILEPDRAHFHHRLVDLGIPVPRAVLMLYALSLLMSLIALSSAEVP